MTVKKPDVEQVIGGAAVIWLHLQPWLTGMPLRAVEMAAVQLHDAALILASLVRFSRFLVSRRRER